MPKKKYLDREIARVGKRIGELREYLSDLSEADNEFRAFIRSVSFTEGHLVKAADLCKKHNIQIPEKYVRTIIEIPGAEV